MNSHYSIRDQLEADAWRRHRGFARRISRKPQATRHPLSPAHSAGGREQPCPVDRRPLKWQDRALLVLATLLLLLLIIRVETAGADTAEEEFFGLEFRGQAGAYRTVALDTDIEVEITGLAARVEVTQAFKNTGAAWKEAVYRYPLPPGAAVDRMQLSVGERMLEGEIREKKEARRQYRQAKARGQVASLVEQQRVNQFETRLANIGPGDEILVSIGFLASVDYRDGSFSLRIPLTFTPRWDSRQTDSEDPAFARLNDLESVLSPDDHRLSVDVDLRSGLDLTRVESRYHDVDIHPSLDGYHIYLVDPDTRTDRVFELDWTPEFGSVPLSTLSTFDDGESVYAQLMLAPPLPEAITPQPREAVFVIDTSGSMEGNSLHQAKAALKLGLEFLGPEDRFNLVRFSSDSESLFRESMPVYPSYLEEADAFIDHLSANGGTVMAPALEMAMNLPEQAGLLRQIVFVTDGSVGNEQELLLQIGEDLGDSRLFTVSIGSAPNAWFMRKSAEIGRGNHTHIGRLEEVKERMTSLWSRIENPAIQNLCVDWGMDADFYPDVIPDLYAGEPLWLYARLPREPLAVTVCGELENRYWEMESRTLAMPGSENLATLWARSKIEAIEDSRIFGADPELIRQDVLDLALQYGLLTQYTSLVAVDRTRARPASEKLARDEIPSLLPEGGGTSSGFSGTSTGWVTQGLLALFALSLASGMLLYLPPSRTRTARGDRSPMTSSVP